MPVLGTNNLARIAQISDATKVTIDRQSWFEIYEAANGREVPVSPETKKKRFRHDHIQNIDKLWPNFQQASPLLLV